MCNIGLKNAYTVFAHECCNIRGNALIGTEIMRNQKAKAGGFRVKEENHRPKHRTNAKDWRNFEVPLSPEVGQNLGVTVQEFEWGTWWRHTSGMVLPFSSTCAKQRVAEMSGTASVLFSTSSQLLSHFSCLGAHSLFLLFPWKHVLLMALLIDTFEIWSHSKMCISIFGIFNTKPEMVVMTLKSQHR